MFQFPIVHFPNLNPNPNWVVPEKKSDDLHQQSFKIATSFFSLEHRVVNVRTSIGFLNIEQSPICSHCLYEHVV